MRHNFCSFQPPKEKALILEELKRAREDFQNYEWHEMYSGTPVQYLPFPKEYYLAKVKKAEAKLKRYNAFEKFMEAQEKVREAESEIMEAEEEILKYTSSK